MRERGREVETEGQVKREREGERGERQRQRDRETERGIYTLDIDRCRTATTVRPTRSPLTTAPMGER